MSYDLGKILIQKKNFSKALDIFSNKLEKNSNDLRANFQMGKIFYELNDLNKSYKFFKKCDEIQPKTPNVLFNLALILQSTGKIQDAKKKYLDLISINPKDIKSYYGLYALNIENITAEFYQNLIELNKDKKISIFERSLINFIFSKIEKKKENFKKEINYLKLSHKQCYQANLILNNQSDFYYNNIISKNFSKINFSGEFKPITKFNESEHIFIIGLPRSGSSLVETIITHNNENIFSMGEFHGINTSILEQIGEVIYAKDFVSKDFKFEINRNKFQESLNEKYNHFEKNIFLDKSLENFFNIEIILEFFPNAKFVHTYRRFKDAVVAIYQSMLPELSWTNNIENIIQYVKLYEKTIEYFKNKYPNKIIDVALNKLTDDKEYETMRILKFCEIDIKENYLNFEKNKKLYNKTNSFLQVRNKIKKYDNKKYQSYYHLLDKI